MPKSKEYISSDDDSDEPVQSKKRKQQKEMTEKGQEASKKIKKEPDENKDNVWDLGNNRQISVREFKGKLYVDIREMYYDKELNLKPGKKGIFLSIQQWRKLLDVGEEVDKAIKTKF